MNFKDIHIGTLLKQAIAESEIEILRICNFLKCTEEEILKIYEAESIDSLMLLKWSKLLNYDFFRLYSQHLVLYSPQGSRDYKQAPENKKQLLPKFQKNIYTKEIIYFILELIDTGEKTKLQIIEDYKIPKTTLYKWIKKYKM